MASSSSIEDDALKSENGDFTEVDAHATKELPASATVSLTRAAEHLAQHPLVPFPSSPINTARVLFRWICEFIAPYGDASPEDTFKRRKGSGNKLFVAMAQHVGLEVQLVDGFTSRGRDATYTNDVRHWAPPSGDEPDAAAPAIPADDALHYWAAVYVAGKWRLLDCNYAAGGYDPVTDKFTKEFDRHYWLTPPEAFIADHFPGDPTMQFLDPPVTVDKFFAMVPRSSTFFKRRLQLDPAFENGTMECPTPLNVITIVDRTVDPDAPYKMEPTCSFHAQLVRADKHSTPLEGRVLVQRRAKLRWLVDIIVMLPSDGTFILSLFVGNLLPLMSGMEGIQQHWKPCLHYRLLSRASTTAGLPELDTRFPVTIIAPLGGSVAPGPTEVEVQADCAGERLGVWTADAGGTPRVEFLHPKWTESGVRPPIMAATVNFHRSAGTDRCMLCLCVERPDGKLDGVGLASWKVKADATASDGDGDGDAVRTADPEAAGEGHPAVELGDDAPQVSHVDGLPVGSELTEPTPAPTSWFSCCTKR